MKLEELTGGDRAAVQAFTNFLSWGEHPHPLPGVSPAVVVPKRLVPPAWWAYALGATQWCPPKGEW